DVFLNLQNPTWSMERKRAFLLEQGFIEMLTLAFLFHAETDLSVFYKKRCPDQGVNIYIVHLDFRKVNTMEAFAFDNGAGFLTWQNEYFASLIGANLKNNTDILKKIYLTCLTVIVLPLHFLVNFFKKFASDDQKAILLAQKM